MMKMPERKENKMTYEENIKLASTIFSRYQSYKAHLKSENTDKIVRENVDFYEGRQWAKATEKTKSLPRPVFPLTSLIINTQISNILGNPYRLNFVNQGESFASDVFTQFSDYQFKEAHFDSYLEGWVKDAEVKCSGIAYEYWDEYARGKNGRYKGALRFQRLDPLELAVADPTNDSIQEQEWIIYPERVSIKEARKMCKLFTKEQTIKLITPDGKDSEYDEKELDGTEKVTVYTMFYRVDGEVCFVKSTKNVVIVGETYLNPFITKKELEDNDKDLVEDIDNEQIQHEDGSHNNTQDSELKYKEKYGNYMFSKYPFAKLDTVPKEKSFLGLGTAFSVVPNNKLINLVSAYNLMNVQNLAWGKIIVKKDALKGQTITNTPGQVLVDYTPGTGFGITNMPGQQTLSNGALEQCNTYIDLTRAMHNSDEIMTGDMLSKNLSGTAIAQIEAMRTKNVDRKQRRVWRFIEELGEIAYQFYIGYFENEMFFYEMPEDMYALSQQKGLNLGKKQQLIIDGTAFVDYDFDVVCEVGSGSQFSEISQMQQLDNLLSQGHIDFEEYVELYPDNQMPYKTRLKQIEAAKKNSELEQWKQAYNELANNYQDLQQKNEYLQQKSNAMEQYAGNLKKTFKESIDEKNSRIKSMEDFMATKKVANDDPNVQ